MRLTVENFCGLRKAKIDTQASVLCLGANGQGKTSLLNAVRFILTGVVFDQAEKRVKVPELVGPHADRAYVELDYQGVTLQCQISRRGSALRAIDTDGNSVYEGSPDEIRRALFRDRKLRESHVFAACHPKSILLSGELTKILGEMVDTIDWDQFTALCGEHFAWLRGWCRDQHFKPASMADLKRLGPMAYDARTGANRDVKRLQSELDRLPKGPRPQADRETVESAIRAMRQQRDVLQRELGIASKRRTEAEIDAEREAVQEARCALEEPQDLTELETEEEALRSGFIEAQATEAAAKRTWQEAQAAAKQLPSGGTCPTCGQPLPKADEKARATLSARVSAAEKTFKATSQAADLAQKRFDAFVSKLTQARKQGQAIAQKRIDLERRLAALAAEEAAGDTADLEPQIADLDARIAEQQTTAEALSAFDNRSRLEGELTRVAAEAEELNWAVDAFRDGKVLNALGRGARDAFLGRVNERLESYGLKIVAPESDDALVIEHADGLRLPLAVASDGELLLVQVAVVDAFGVGIGVIDRLDGLDGQKKGEFMMCLGERENIVAAAAWGQAYEPKWGAICSAIEPASAVWVSNGVATVMTQEAGD